MCDFEIAKYQNGAPAKKRCRIGWRLFLEQASVPKFELEKHKAKRYRHEETCPVCSQDDSAEVEAWYAKYLEKWGGVPYPENGKVKNA